MCSLHDTLRQSKCNLKSIAIRSSANDAYKKSPFTDDDCYQAIKCYNNSICFAETPENLSIGYENRSAICFTLKFYDKCMLNIQLARATNGCPPAILNKLMAREESCKIEMENAPQSQDEIVKTPDESLLDFAPHPKIPFIGNCMELKTVLDNRMGVVANQRLQEGKVIAVEQAFSSVLPKRFLYGRCEYCCRKCIETAVPCSQCTVAMFCDEKFINRQLFAK